MWGQSLGQRVDWRSTKGSKVWEWLGSPGESRDGEKREEDKVQRVWKENKEQAGEGERKQLELNEN